MDIPPGHQQFDYPIHNIRVMRDQNTHSSTRHSAGAFSNERCWSTDPHTYRPEFSSNNWVYDGLVEYGPEVKSFLLLRYLGISRIEPEVAKYTPSTYVRMSSSMMTRPGTAMLQSLILTMC